MGKACNVSFMYKRYPTMYLVFRRINWYLITEKCVQYICVVVPGLSCYGWIQPSCGFSHMSASLWLKVVWWILSLPVSCDSVLYFLHPSPQHNCWLAQWCFSQQAMHSSYSIIPLSCPFLTSLLRYHHQYIHTLEFSRGQFHYFICVISCQDWEMSVRVRVNLMDVELGRLRKDKLWYHIAVTNTSFDILGV